MSRYKEKQILKDPLFTGIAVAAVLIILYGLLAYPFYTFMKIQDVKRAYKELCTMELAAIGTENEEVLRSIQSEQLEYLIVDENFNLVYSNWMMPTEQQLEKSIKAHLEEYQEEPLVLVKKYSSMRVIRLRALIRQAEKTYYVFIRREIRGISEVLRYSMAYMCMSLIIVSVLCSFVSKKNKRREEDEASYSRMAEAQREFIANITHELKTPLAVISGQVEMLQCMGDGIDRDYYFASIREEIDKMSEMVGNLLDISIVEHHVAEMEKSRVDISEMMSYMLLKYDALLKKNKIKVQSSIDEGCAVYGNRMYLEQAVNNYLMNAFQRTAQGNEMKIELIKEQKNACIRVYNDGERIPQKEIDHIWKSFYVNTDRNEDRKIKISNAGLGLYMVKKIVQQHNGSCGVENKERGVEFWMRIPLMQRTKI